MDVNNLSGIGSTGYIMNPATVVDASVTTGGVSAESDSSGIAINLIPAALLRSTEQPPQPRMR